MKHLDQIASMLFADDVRAKVEKILSSLIVEADARGGAVLALRNDKLVLFGGQDLPLTELATLENRWPALQKEVTAGRTIEDKNLTVAPLSDRGGLTGVLVLEAARAFDLEDSTILRSLIARALGTPATPVVNAAANVMTEAAPAVPAHEIERRRLMDTLQRHEWNVALVARTMGVTRRTIYLRMERYKIDRQRVPKTLKRSPSMA
jgi:hypothetical protein